MFSLERLATQARVGWLNGVVVATKAGFVRFDPLTKGRQDKSCVFISHAHGDHVGGLRSGASGYLTAETRDILSKGRDAEEAENFVALRYGDRVDFDGLDVTVHNSGHILGSAQYELRDAESSIVYTGDLNCREMLTTTAAKAIPCDTLVLETTYGNPFYIFPSAMDIYVRIVDWAIDEIKKGRTPTFTVYSVGKAQEIVKAFNEFTNIPVVTSPSVAKVNEAYDKNGINLKYIDAASEEGKELLEQPCVQVVSPREKPPVSDCCSYASATGWALRSSTNSVAFPLSSHADFNQLVEYVRLAKPKEVLTIHGFKKEFASYLSRKLGIRAREIPPLKQGSLKAYI